MLISIDGKRVKGTVDAEDPHGTHLLAAYLPQEGLVLLQVAAGHKRNEIGVAPTLVQALDLRGKIVTADALHTQRALSVQILAAGGEYVWQVKENQPTLRADIAELFTADPRTGDRVGAAVPLRGGASIGSRLDSDLLASPLVGRASGGCERLGVG